MKVRGHSVFWDVEKNVPDWVKALNTTQLLPALMTHLDYMINLARGKSVTFQFFNNYPPPLIHKRVDYGQYNKCVYFFGRIFS